MKLCRDENVIHCREFFYNVYEMFKLTSMKFDYNFFLIDYDMLYRQ